MEMLLIILGGILVTAIVFVLMERPPHSAQAEQADPPFEEADPEDPLLTPELMARLRREFARRHA